MVLKKTSDILLAGMNLITILEAVLSLKFAITVFSTDGLSTIWNFTKVYLWNQKLYKNIILTISDLIALLYEFRTFVWRSCCSPFISDMVNMICCAFWLVTLISPTGKLPFSQLKEMFTSFSWLVAVSFIKMGVMEPHWKENKNQNKLKVYKLKIGKWKTTL